MGEIAYLAPELLTRRRTNLEDVFFATDRVMNNRKSKKYFHNSQESNSLARHAKAMHQKKDLALSIAYRHFLEPPFICRRLLLVMV
jgi:hypothetical protein